MNQSKKNKGNHYITESYQRNFSDVNGQIYVLMSDGKIIGPTNPENTFKEDYFYLVKLPMGGGTLEVETTLGKIEGEYIPASKKLENGEEINEKERIVISMFIAAMFDRTKIQRNRKRNALIKILNEGKKRQTELNEELKIGRKPAPSFQQKEVRGVSLKELEEGIQNFDNYHSASIIELVQKITPKIFNMLWSVVKTNDKIPFVSSDNPVCMCSPDREKKYGANTLASLAGLDHDDVELSFPLSKTSALIATWNKYLPKNLIATPEQVNQLNFRSIKISENIFSNRKDVLYNICSERSAKVPQRP
ncbi:MAG: DUF4238 domain-containing protein [Parcubacteria group bacterium]|nr:DUF4238 domain-containing protein [Parcubacteria group bacterium]